MDKSFSIVRVRRIRLLCFLLFEIQASLGLAPSPYATDDTSQDDGASNHGQHNESNHLVKRPDTATGGWIACCSHFAAWVRIKVEITPATEKLIFAANLRGVIMEAMPAVGKALTV